MITIRDLFPSCIGMMAMFSVKFAYKLSSVMFSVRPSYDNKNYYSDLVTSACDRIEYCLVKHLLFLLDSFGLYPSLKDSLDTENELEWEIAVVFAAYHKDLVPRILYEKLIEDEDRELEALKSNADTILEGWDRFFRSSHSSRSLGIAWPLKHGDVKGLPPIAHIIMAWGFYIGERFRKIDDHLDHMLRQDPTMTSADRDQMIIQNESLNMSLIFKGSRGKTIWFKQVKRSGAHLWGKKSVFDGRAAACEVVEVGSFDCFEILSTKKDAYNLVDFASKILQPSDSPPQFDSKSFLHETSKIETFEVESEDIDGEEAIQYLSPGIFQKTWNDDDLRDISQGKVLTKNSKCPKLTLQNNASSHIVSVLNMRKGDEHIDLSGLVGTIVIGYGSNNCEVQLVNMIKLQEYLRLDDEQMFDLNAYKVLSEYCGMKKYPFRFPDHKNIGDIFHLRTPFLTYFPQVKQDLLPVLREFSSGNVVKGHASTNIRKRDRSNITSTDGLTFKSPANSDSDESTEENEFTGSDLDCTGNDRDMQTDNIETYDDNDNVNECSSPHSNLNNNESDVQIDDNESTKIDKTPEHTDDFNPDNVEPQENTDDIPPVNNPVDNNMDATDIDPINKSQNEDSTEHASEEINNSSDITIDTEKSPKKKKPKKKKPKKN